MNTKKGLINPVLHEIRSPNSLSTRVSGLKYQNDYPKSIERMAGVGYNRNSNKLRELNEQATATAIGARPNPEYSKNRFTGLYGREALNQPQKHVNYFDSKIKQKKEILRNGNENRRFEKSENMKKTSYENGIAGAGYSGEIIVTPKRGRPYKGQPNSLPLVSKRQKIKKEGNENPPNPKENPKLNSFFESPEYKYLKGQFGQFIAQSLLDKVGPIGAAIYAKEYANSPEKLQFIGNAVESALSSATTPFNAIMTPEIVNFLAPKSKSAKIMANASKIIGPAQTLYGYGSSGKNFLDAVEKEFDYLHYGTPAFNPAIAQNEANQPIKRFDSFGNAATDNVDYDFIPEDFLPNVSDEYRDNIITYLNAIGFGKNKNFGFMGTLFDALNSDKNSKNPINPIANIFSSSNNTSSALDAYLQNLTPAQRDEFGRFGNPTTIRRKTVNPVDSLVEALINQYAGSGNVTPMWSNHANNSLFEQNDMVFGDLGANRGLSEAPQYYIEGYTPQGVKRKTGVSYINQPDGKNMPMYDLNKKPTTQSSSIPLFADGLSIASKYLNQIQNGEIPDFSPVKSADLINSIDEKDPGWYSGVQLTKPVPKVKFNALDNFNNNNDLFKKENTKKSATFAKSLYSTKDKYNNTEKVVAKLVNIPKKTNKYFK